MISHIADVQMDSKREATLFCFGDLQADAKGFNMEAWEQFRNEFKATPNAVALGLGDYNDFSRPTMRAAMLSALSKDDSTRQQIDDMVRKQQDRLLDKMAFLEGKLVGIHNGHHCWDFADGTNSDQRIATALKAPYLGWMAGTRLLLRYGKKPGHSFAYTMVSLHGNSNARKTGGAASWTEDNVVRSWIADQYVLGHCCKGMSWVPSERNTIRRQGPAGIETTLPKVLQVPGFHSGFAESGGYVERNSFPPQPCGWGVIKFKAFHRKAAMELKGTQNALVLGSDQSIRYWRQ